MLHSTSSRTFGMVKIGILLSLIMAMPRMSAFRSIVDGPQRRPLSSSQSTRNQLAVVPESSFSKEEDEVDPTLTTAPKKKLSNMERAWRHVKKPLLRLGARQGATIKHGNSLRELLQQHTMVKVKIQLRLSRHDDDDDAASNDVDAALRDAFQPLRDCAVQSGASPDIELLQVRAAERTLLIGLPGTREQIAAGLFPPIIPIPSFAKEEEDL